VNHTEFITVTDVKAAEDVDEGTTELVAGQDALFQKNLEGQFF
jgi:hypothetical protein